MDIPFPLVKRPQLIAGIKKGFFICILLSVTCYEVACLFFFFFTHLDTAVTMQNVANDYIL